MVLANNKLLISQYKIKLEAITYLDKIKELENILKYVKAEF